MKKFIPYPDKCKPNCYQTSLSDCAKCEVELEIQARITEDVQKQYLIHQIMKIAKMKNIDNKRLIELLEQFQKEVKQ